MSAQGVLATNPLFGNDKPDFTRLAGTGAPAIVALPAVKLGATAAVTNFINFIPPATKGLYRLSAQVNVTAWTTPASFTLVATYTNAGGATTITLATFEGDGTSSALIDEVENFFAVPIVFDVDASATAITLSTTGTFTGSPVYNLAGMLERLL